MKKLLFLSLIATLTLLTSCSVNLARKHKNSSNSIYRIASEPKTFADVNMNSYNIEEQKAPKLIYNLLSLPPDAQAEYIKSLQLLYHDNPADFIRQINTNFNFNKEEKSYVKIIPKTFKKELIFSTQRSRYTRDPKTGAVTFNLEGDRVAYLRYTLKIPTDVNLKYNYWNKSGVTYFTLNLGKVNSSQQFSTTVNMSLKGSTEVSLGKSDSGESSGTDKNVIVINNGEAPNSTIETSEILNSLKQTGTNSTGAKTAAEYGGSASLSYADKYETSQDLTDRIVDLGSSLSEKELMFVQQGGVGMDLTGSVKVIVEYTLTDDWATPVKYLKFKKLFNDDDTPIPYSQLKYYFLTILFPDIKKDIVGDLDYDFLYRQVNSGNRHIPEARHKITNWYGNVPAAIKPVLVKKNEIRPIAYVFELSANTVGTGGGGALLFETINEATTFLHYLTELDRLGMDISSFRANGANLTSTQTQSIIIKTINL